MARENNISINVLFTSVGRRVELVKAFQDAYGALGIRGNIVATDIDPLAPALQLVDKKYIVPRVTAAEYISTIKKICLQEEIGRLFPLIDPDIPVLSKHIPELEAAGAMLAVVPPQASDICNDKWLTTQFFERLGLSTPQSWLPGDAHLNDSIFPLFVKPRNGSASMHTFRANNRKELEFFLNYVPNPIVQECMTGPEITNDVICDVTGEVLGIISRKRIEVRTGEVAKGVTIFDKDISDACLRIAGELPAIGPITVQCMLHQGIPRFTEINARLGGGIPLGIAAGANSPLWLLARAAGIAIDIPPIGSYQTGLYITRYNESFFLTESDREELGSHHI